MTIKGHLDMRKQAAQGDRHEKPHGKANGLGMRFWHVPDAMPRATEATMIIETGWRATSAIFGRRRDAHARQLER